MRNTSGARALLLTTVRVRPGRRLAQDARRRIQTTQKSNDLPALLLRQSAPAGHSLVHLAVLDDPGNLAVCSSSQAVALQAGPRAPAFGICAVAPRTVITKEIPARQCSIRLASIRIHAFALCLRNLLQPRAVRDRETHHRRAEQSGSYNHPGLHFVLRNQSRNCEIS